MGVIKSKKNKKCKKSKKSKTQKGGGNKFNFQPAPKSGKTSGFKVTPIQTQLSQEKTIMQPRISIPPNNLTVKPGHTSFLNRKGDMRSIRNGPVKSLSDLQSMKRNNMSQNSSYRLGQQIIRALPKVGF